MDHIPDVAKGFSRDKTFQAILSNIDKLMKQLKQLIARRTRNKESLIETCSEIILSIKATRQQLDEILNQLEMKTIEEMDRLMLSLNNTMKAQIDNCNGLYEEMNNIQDTIGERSGQISDTLAFISHKRCKEKICEAKNLLQSLVEEDYDMKFTPAEEIEQALTGLQVLGTMTITPELTAHPNLTSSETPEKVLGIQEMRRYNVKLQMENQGEISTNGMVLLESGNVVLIDNINNNVKLLNENRMVIAQRRLLSSPHDICAVGNTRVAVTFSDWTKKEIQFLDTATGKIESQDKLKLKHSCYGIVHHDGKLYVSSHYAIFVHEMDGTQLKVLYENKSSKYAIFRFAIADDAKTFYITNKNSNILMTLNEQGKLVATLADPDLKFPSGVCVAADGSVLVCCWESQTVLHVDSEGRKKLATIARNCEGVLSPWCLCYDRKSSELLIGGYYDVLLGLTVR